MGRSFMTNINSDSNSTDIVKSTIIQSQMLNLSVVAEPMDDLANTHTLAELICNTIHSYGIAKPMKTKDSHKWLFSRGNKFTKLEN